MRGGCFSAAGTEGIVRVKKSSMHQTIEIIHENPVQSIQNLRLDRKFTFQQDNEPKHTAREAYRQLCECLWVAQTQPGLEPNQIFLEKPENVRLPHSTWQSLRGEEVRRRMADNCQMMMRKACRIKKKRLEVVKVLQLNIYLILMQCTYLSFLFLIHLRSCDNSVFTSQYGVWGVDWCGGKSHLKQ